MGLGELFDGVVREIGRSDAGALIRATDDSFDGLFRGSEKRCRQRFNEQYRQSQQVSSSSSSNSGGSLGSLLVSAAMLGGLALLCNSGDDKKTATNK